MIRALFLVAGLSLVFVNGAVADDSDDTLSFWLGKSDLVLLGEIVTPLSGIMKDLGTPNYHFDFSVTEVLKGDASLGGATIPVIAVRFEATERDRHLLIAKGSECILFLRKTENVPLWKTSDFWFGVQHRNQEMEQRLKKLAQQEEKPR